MQAQVSAMMSRIEVLQEVNKELAEYVKAAKSQNEAYMSEREVLVKENAALMAKLKGKRQHDETVHPGPSKGGINRVGTETGMASDGSSKETKSPILKKKKVTVKQIPTTAGIIDKEGEPNNVKDTDEDTDRVTINNIEDGNSTDASYAASGDEQMEEDGSESGSDSSSSSDDETDKVATKGEAKPSEDKHSPASW